MPGFVQTLLDAEVAFHNTYPVRAQPGKINPSGASRNEIYFDCTRWGGTECLQRFDDLEVIRQWRDDAREEAELEWVSNRVREVCAAAVRRLGCPWPVTGWGDLWTTFTSIVKECYGDIYTATQEREGAT